MGMKGDQFVAILNDLGQDKFSREDLKRISEAHDMRIPWRMLNEVSPNQFTTGNVAYMPPMATSQNTAPAPVAVKSQYTTNVEILPPTVDKNYIAWGNHADLQMIIKSRIFHPVYISGPTGNGKSTMVEQICAAHKIPLIRVNLNNTDDEDKLIASKTLVNGDIQVEDGPIVVAMRRGIPVLIDEIDAGNANLLMCLQGVLEGKPLYLKAKNELVYPQPGFNVIATANTKGKGNDDGRYIGTNTLNEAFLERFAIMLEQSYPAAKIEVKMLNKLGAVLKSDISKPDYEFFARLVVWAEAIRKTYEDGGIDETITTRRLLHIVKNYVIFGDQLKAIKFAVNRFDNEISTAFIEIYEKMMPEDVASIPAEAEAPQEIPPEEVPF
jgi:hypothetical protein